MALSERHIRNLSSFTCTPLTSVGPEWNHKNGYQKPGNLPPPPTSLCRTHFLCTQSTLPPLSFLLPFRCAGWKPGCNACKALSYCQRIATGGFVCKRATCSAAHSTTAHTLQHTLTLQRLCNALDNNTHSATHSTTAHSTTTHTLQHTQKRHTLGNTLGNKIHNALHVCGVTKRVLHSHSGMPYVKLYILSQSLYFCGKESILIGLFSEKDLPLCSQHSATVKELCRYWVHS